MKKIVLILLVAAGAAGCDRTGDDELVPTSPVVSPTATTNDSTGMGDVEGTIGEGAQRTGEPEQPHPPSGSR